MNSKTETLVIGGGIIGIFSALQLLRSGQRVSLLESGDPGKEASFGNAGCLAVSEVVPISLPGMLRHVPGWLMDPLGPLSIRARHFPKLVPWLMRFNQMGNDAQVEKASRAQADLMKLTESEWRETSNNSNFADQVTWNGKLMVYETQKGMENDRGYWEWCQKNGVEFHELSGDEIRQMEPALTTRFAGGILTPAYAHVSDPYEIARTLLDRFVAEGGTVITARARHFADSHSLLLENGGTIAFEKAVIAAGVWSKKLANDLGYKVLLEAERGYNTTLPNAGLKLNRPIMFGEQHFVISPLACGLRIGGAAEFAGLSAPANFQRSKNLLKIAKKYLPELDETEKREWMGPRPSTPDSLAVIGQAPRHPNILFAFGHGHLGLTQAAGTARLVQQLANGEKPAIDLSPFSIERFN
ncbi:NAD(P)/FAD-dependent oxidoreductase [Aestuariispira insulae]|uniref:Glycine/D-amino acid oxidase-like deaminating enzyme n=1 Tax=Aestuariispira insulae TaxID=1461337 RepID=A0A3D9HVB7_9PROT|nr:FAD-binding oxidoreductase [Aestuariispira insulae]RED53453.1 glycine/D-amino acid oxidase-like deaminating enzyme [Aestuariispira insulae]